MTAGLLRVLGHSCCRRQDFLDGVSRRGEPTNFEDCMKTISRCLADRGLRLSFTDGGEESEGGEIDGCEAEETTVWPEDEE